jgi:hypothetical protein
VCGVCVYVECALSLPILTPHEIWKLPSRGVALGNHVHEESACPEECVPSPASVERVRHSVCFLRRDTSRASARVSAINRDQSHRIVPHIVLVNFRAGQHRQRQVHIHTRFSHTLHIHTRFTFTHASHSHTLHTHTRFTFTHASHSHTRQPFRIVPHIVLVNFRAGQHR